MEKGMSGEREPVVGGNVWIINGIEGSKRR